jgi:hypothetical protein
MGAAQKRLAMVMSNLTILENIYRDCNLPQDYFDNLDNVRNRIIKLPKLAEKNEKLLIVELDYIVTEVKDMFDEVDPRILSNYDLTVGGGDIGKDNPDDEISETGSKK